MKFFIVFLALTLSLLSQDVDTKPFKSIKMLSAQHITIVKAYDHNLVYELELEIDTPNGKQHTTAYVSKDKKVVMFGDMFNAQTGEPIKRPINMKSIRENADVVYGHGSKEYIVFTDPECPYCVKFEKMWPSLAMKVKLYVYFMPLSNHRNATQMSYHVMNQKTQVLKSKAIIDMAHGDKSFERLSMTQTMHDVFSKKIEANQALANEFGVKGTPAVFDTKGADVQWPTLGR